MNSRRLLRNRHTWVNRNWETNTLAKAAARTAPSQTMPIPLHDFCLTIPFGFLIGFGGLMGFLSAGSVASLASGGGVGGLLCWLGFQSLAEFKRAQDGGAKYECAKYCNACLLLCLVLFGVMQNKAKAEPWYVPVGGVSWGAISMCAFYALKGRESAHEVGKKTE